MRLSDFDYDLPESSIAQYPPQQRDGGRLMLLPRQDDSTESGDFDVRDLPRLLPRDALLVINDSRVIPARIEARRQTGGRVEILLIERLHRAVWRCMLRASKTPHEGERLELADGQGSCELIERCGAGRWTVSLPEPAVVERCGRLPLPPYIHRVPEPSDYARYQTVFARREGSVAAPTAGLHFTEPLVAAIEARGVDIAPVTLHVGPGTFVPVRCDDPAEHQMESERFEVPERTARAIAEAKRSGRPVVAVGTTVVRALESSGGRAGAARTSLMIVPGHRFTVVDGILTNFHLPRSTLLMLVCAFAGRQRVIAAYRHAVSAGYRFYSYGDAMLIR